MSNIKINLNPIKRKILGGPLQQVVTYTPLIFLGVCGLFIVIFFMNGIILAKSHSYKVYNKKWQEQKKRYSVLIESKQEIAELENEVKSSKEVLVSKNQIAYILEDIVSSLPKNIWFTSINFRDDLINIKGYVVRWKEDYLVSLDRFIVFLRDKDYFSQRFNIIQIKDSKTTKFNDVEVVQFVIECKK